MPQMLQILRERAIGMLRVGVLTLVRMILWIGVCNSVFQLLLKRSRLTFYRPQSTLCERDVSHCMRQMVVTPDTEISDLPSSFFLGNLGASSVLGRWLHSLPQTIDQLLSIYYLLQAIYQPRCTLHFDVSATSFSSCARTAAPVLCFYGQCISLSNSLSCLKHFHGPTSSYCAKCKFHIM